ncbi:MAG TPA: SRPBCC family protein [Candidatus Acidoferrales bacterium]|jgi:hypothetical protein|nr:SRPBCC family protein [Candidatus Acidoferrales bacterium]
MIPILLALAFIALVFIIVVTGQPGEFKVSRSATISALPDKVFPHVNDLHKWEAWSPWAKLDPNAKNTFDGPALGTGSSMAWDGNNKVGSGKMTITDSKPGEAIRFQLVFLKPMQATNTAEFTFRPEGDQTVVVWSMAGKNSFAGKMFGLLMNCDKMCGDQFERGLASLKRLAEA